MCIIKEIIKDEKLQPSPYYNLYFSKLKSILPGKYKTTVDIRSRSLNEIIKLIDQLPILGDTVILHTVDPLNLARDEENIILNHARFENKKVFLSTLGYKNEYRGNNHWVLSFPIFYFMRPQAPFRILKKDLNYGYSCLNNRPANHRLLLGYHLYKRNLLSGMIFTQHYNRNVQGFGSEDIVALTDFDKYSSQFPITWSEDNTYVDANIVPDGLDITIQHPAYSEAYCNIVTESSTEYSPFSTNINVPAITEKSYKPFISGQVPVMLAPRGHNAYLTSLGFEMVEDVLPVGYDQMPVLKKIAAIVDLVSKGKEYIQDFYFDHQQEIKHNHALVSSDQVDTIILNNIKDIINAS